MSYDVLITSLFLNSGHLRYAFFDFLFSSKIQGSAETKQRMIKTIKETLTSAKSTKVTLGEIVSSFKKVFLFLKKLPAKNCLPCYHQSQWKLTDHSAFLPKQFLKLPDVSYRWQRHKILIQVQSHCGQNAPQTPRS